MKILTDPRSGSYQGITSSRNRFGQYVRTRAVPVQPRTVRQGLVRGQFGVAATRWRGLTGAQRAAWSAIANNYRNTDSLGQSNAPTGFAFFISANLASLTYLGVPTTDDAPLALASFVLDLGATTFTLDISAQTLSVAFADSPMPADHVMAVETTGPVSPGVVSPPGPAHWKFLGSIQATQTTPQFMTTAYIAQHGAIATGQNVFFRVADFDSAAFRRSAWATIVGTVVA